MRSLILGVVIAAAAIGLAALTINTPNSAVGIIGSGVGLLVGAIFIHNGIFALSWRLGLIIRGAAGAIIAAITFSMFGANPSTEQFGMALLGIFLILWAMFEWRKRTELEQNIQTIAKLPPDKIQELLQTQVSLQDICHALSHEGFDTKNALIAIASDVSNESRREGGLSDERQSQLKELKENSPWLHTRDPRVHLQSREVHKLIVEASSYAVAGKENAEPVKGAVYLTPAHLVFVGDTGSLTPNKLAKKALVSLVSKATFGISDLLVASAEMTNTFLDDHPPETLLEGLDRETSFSVYIGDIRAVTSFEGRIKVLAKDETFSLAFQHPDDLTRKQREALNKTQHTALLQKLNDFAILHGRR
ncbi:MAG: hypothetical protein RIC14_00680 [Filomicrobium sp.]